MVKRSEEQRGCGIISAICALTWLLFTTWMVFYADTNKWQPLQCFTAASEPKATPAPNELRVGCVNVNGLKTRVQKRAAVALLHEGDASFPAHDIMMMCEIANKAAGTTKLTDEDKMAIVKDVNPFGRGWVTPFVMISLAPSMAGVAVEVAASADERIMRMDFTWGEDEVTVMVPYVPSDPDKRPEFLRRLADFIPADRQVLMAGDFNCVPDPERDSKHQHSTYRNRGGTDLVVVTDAFDLHDLACAASAPDAEQGWMTFSSSSQPGRQYERRLDQMYTSHELLNKTDVTAFHTRPTGIPGIDHHLLSTVMRLSPRPEADPDGVFPGMRLDVIFAGDFVEDVRDMLTCLNNRDLPGANDAEAWCERVDGFTRQVQDHYLVHFQEVRKARTLDAKHVLEKLEQFTAARADDVSDDYFDKRRTMMREHANVVERETAAVHKTEDIAMRSFREQCTRSYRTKVQPRSQSGVFHSQLRFDPPDRPEQSLEFVMGALGDDRGWTQPRGPPRPAVDPRPTSVKGELTSADDIIANTELFWSTLYRRYRSHVPCQRHCLERLAACVNKVPAEELEKLARPLTLDEVITAIHSLKTGKVAGPNGIPAELYAACAEEWAPSLQQQFNACFAANSCLSELQRRGRIAQLFKSGLRADCANFRPVCALNKDYQICSSCQNARFVDVAAMLTGHDQTGFIPGRFMSWNIRKFLDVFHYTRDMNTPAAAILFDFRKAYDNVSHAFLFAIIDIMCGVPLDDVWEDLQAAQAAPPGEYVYLHSAPPTQWLQTLYRKHLRTVTVNGTTTGWFFLESSVPQGDVLAPTAFVLYIEALGILLRTDPDIHGVTLPSSMEMIAARFADDTGVTVTPESIAAVMRAVEVFSAASGMVNHSVKTVGLWLGSLASCGTAWEQAAFAGDLLSAVGKAPRLTWLRSGSVMKLLGVMLGYDVDPKTEWLKISSAMLTILRMWSAVPLSIRARVVLVKALVWSKAWFLAQYRAMPTRLRDLMWGACVYYVAKGGLPPDFSLAGDGTAAPRVAVSRAELERPSECGGVDLWHPGKQMAAQSVKSVRDLLTPEHVNTEPVSLEFPSRAHSTWRELPLYYVDRLNWHGPIAKVNHAAGGVSRRSCKVLAGRGRTVLVEGLDITAQMRRSKTLDMPAHWTTALKDYGVVHAASTILHPENMEECLSMPLFGSPWVLLQGEQIVLTGRWLGWPDRGVSRVLDLWLVEEHRWKTALECWDGDPAPSPIVEIGLVILQNAIPPTWVEMLERGRTVPSMGEWVVLRPTAAPHQGEDAKTITAIGQVVGRYWIDEHQGPGIWIERHEYSELYRGFGRHVAEEDVDLAEQVSWLDTDWSVARAEFSPDANKGKGVYYGATHDVFSWVPRRVQWSDPSNGRFICDLETYTVQAGRRILSPGLNTMSPRAMAAYRRVSTAINPTLTQALEHIWQHNTWLPATREYAWKVLCGAIHTPATTIGQPNVERWQCTCGWCRLESGDEVLDDLDHQVFGCGIAEHTWRWAQRVLMSAGLAYDGTAAGFWMYGGSRALQRERIVSVMRGAFFEALATVRRRVHEGGDVTQDALSTMVRERVMVEAALDVFYVGDSYRQGFAEQGKTAGRPTDATEVLRAWRGLVRGATRKPSCLVCVLPRADGGGADGTTPSGGS